MLSALNSAKLDYLTNKDEALCSNTKDTTFYGKEISSKETAIVEIMFGIAFLAVYSYNPPPNAAHRSPPRVRPSKNKNLMKLSLVRWVEDRQVFLPLVEG